MNENMKVSIAGVEFKKPVITASGCLALVGSMNVFIRCPAWVVFRLKG